MKRLILVLCLAVAVVAVGGERVQILSPVFGTTVLNPFLGSASSTDWWLAGGTPPSAILGAWEPMSAANLAASYTDVSGNGNDVSVSYTGYPTASAPTFSSGWSFDGATQALYSGSTASAITTIIVRYRGATLGVNNAIAGIFESVDVTTSNRLFVNASVSSNTWGIGWGSSFDSYTGDEASAVLAVSNVGAFKDGVFEAAPTGSWVGISQAPITFGALAQYRYNNTEILLFYDNVIIEAAVIGIGLTAAQITAISNAMAAL